MDAGVLLSIPTESIAVRVVIASLVAVLLGRLLLRAGLRVPRVRAATALIPAGALLVVVAVCWGRLRLPAVMLPVDAVDALPVRVRDTYLHFAPIALPLFVGVWASIATLRISLRLHRLWRIRRQAAAAFTLGTTAPASVRRLTASVAARMRVAAPPVAIVPGCPGGASVVGLRRTVVLLDQELVDCMDEEELEGVLAHELAHVRRRDNLVAFVLGFVRDLAFFVPGGRWALKELHAERELAADQLAVTTTRRPGALASGLLKVMDTSTPGVACAALAPSGTLVGRVRRLVEDTEPVGRLRGGLELTLVAAALTTAVTAALQVPPMLAGHAGERDAMAVVWAASGQTTAQEQVVDGGESRAFDVYRRTRITQSHATATKPVIDDDPHEVRPSVLRACASDTGGAVCPHPTLRGGLGLAPRPVVRVDDGLVSQWRANRVVSTNDGIGLYWLERVS